MFSIKLSNGEVLSTVDISEVAFTWKSPVGVLSNKKEFINSII